MNPKLAVAFFCGSITLPKPFIEAKGLSDRCKKRAFVAYAV